MYVLIVATCLLTANPGTDDCQDRTTSTILTIRQCLEATLEVKQLDDQRWVHIPLCMPIADYVATYGGDPA